MAFRWAISSTGKIAADFANAIRQLPGHRVAAVMSRSEASAARFIKKHCDGAVACTDVGELPGIDATYVAGPNDAHFPAVRKLLEAKKAVLCEKSLGTTVEEVETLVETATLNETFLMEGMWTRCFPATVKAREFLRDGKIGDVVKVQAEFGYNIANGCPGSLRGDAKTGGMTLDIGIYLMEKALLAYPASSFDCVQHAATAIHAPTDGVDLSVSASLRFDSHKEPQPHVDLPVAHGGVASLAWSGLADTPETAAIIGTNGAILFDKTHHTPHTFVLREHISRTESKDHRFDFLPPDDDHRHSWNYPGSISLQYEALAVERALNAGLIQAPEWNFLDILSAHRLLHQIKSDLHHRQHHQ